MDKNILYGLYRVFVLFIVLYLFQLHRQFINKIFEYNINYIVIQITILIFRKKNKKKNTCHIFYES